MVVPYDSGSRAHTFSSKYEQSTLLAVMLMTDEASGDRSHRTRIQTIGYINYYAIVYYFAYQRVKFNWNNGSISRAPHTHTHTNTENESGRRNACNVI